MPSNLSGSRNSKSMHSVGVLSAVAASAWLGGAEAPTKLVGAGFSPIVISLCMIFGVFVARWTIPTLLKGTHYLVHDLKRKPHLLLWAVLAGSIWAVANTLTIVAVRDVGLAIAFPIWNINSLVGLFWGWLLFKELRGAGIAIWTRVLGGAIVIMIGAIVLSSVSAESNTASTHHAVFGVTAALGAGILLGTMYIPYRKAYISGLNPLSFVTIFTFGEVITISALALAIYGDGGAILMRLEAAKSSMLWLFLGGFCWVIGDLFQQYGVKYIGISRAIPVSNTNQLWGLAWGAFVFGELAHFGRSAQLLILFASALMILGAFAISTASEPVGERASCILAIERECTRYSMDLKESIAVQDGEEAASNVAYTRHWWDYLILAAATGVFVWLAFYVERPPIAINYEFATILAGILLLFLVGGGWVLWRHSRFA